MVYAQTGASDNSVYFTDYVQMAVAVGKHTLQRFASEYDVAGELLHQDGKISEVGRGV